VDPTTTLHASEHPAGSGGVVLDRYRLERRLGSGGFGTVFLARDLTLERPVAVKVVPHAPGAGPGSRAEREALAAARLNHPGIVALYEAGVDGHAHYLVSELVEGATMGELLRHEALSDRDVVRIGLALCGALSHAHGRGVIHRDVKPQNIVVPAEAQSAAGIAKLTDFGVAHLADDAITHTGDVIGTLAYMAPEQAEGERIGPEADLYSLALVLYEALSGVNPVRAPGAAATARRLGTSLPSLRRARRGLPPVLTAAVDRAIRPRPEQRGDVDELAAALEGALPLVSDDGGAIDFDPEHWDHDAGPEPLDDAYEADRGGWEPIVPDRRHGAFAGDVLAPRSRARHGWRARLFGAAAAGGLAAGATIALHPARPATPLIAAAAALVLVGVLPRVGWLAGAAGLVGTLIALPPGRPGTALLVACALLAVPALLPRRPAAWSLPAGAAAGLGLLGVAGAYPAIAGMASTWRARAALGAAGFWCLALAETVAARTLLVGPAAGTGTPGDFARSGNNAVSDVLSPLFSSGLLAFAALWALAAVMLPWLVRGRSLGSDLAGGVAWAAALAGGSVALGRALGALVASPDPHGAITGAALGAAAAVAIRASRRHPEPEMNP
jgi:hypothetical protein